MKDGAMQKRQALIQRGRWKEGPEKENKISSLPSLFGKWNSDDWLCL